MFNLLTSPRTGRSFRAMVGDLIESAADTIRSLAPADETPVVEAPDPDGLFTEDDLPELADIESAAASYNKAADQARAADRAKRKSKKLLDRLPAGQYGGWLVRRVASSRKTVDLDAVRRIFKEHGLGDVPMRDNAPSLRVERIETAPAEMDAERAAFYDHNTALVSGLSAA